MKKICTIIFVILLSACGSGLNGTYTDASGIVSYTFKSGGKVTMATMGLETEMEYRVEDGKVKIGSPQGALVMPILEDGSIQGPMGIKFTKQKK
ncbi:MAG: hypothetical protein WA112_06665 [Rugosibacter sp.]|jgi:hypothetical protein